MDLDLHCSEGETYHEWMLLADKAQLPVVVQHRVGIVILRFNAKVPVFIVYPQPGLSPRRSKTGIGRELLHGIGPRALSRPFSLMASITSDMSGSFEGSLSLRDLY